MSQLALIDVHLYTVVATIEKKFFTECLDS